MAFRGCSCLSSRRSDIAEIPTVRNQRVTLGWLLHARAICNKTIRLNAAEGKPCDGDRPARRGSMRTVCSALGPETPSWSSAVSSQWGAAATPSMRTVHSALGPETPSWSSAALESAHWNAAATFSMRTIYSALGPETPCPRTCPPLKNPISMVGIFTNWTYDKTEELDPWMDQVDNWPSHFAALPESMVRLKKTVKLTSATFSFQVVCPDKGWDWRLYPRDFKAVMWGMHVSREGLMKNCQREKVVIAVGDRRKGDGKNLHIVGSKGGGDVCTIWMDLPVIVNGGSCMLDTTSEDKLGIRAPKVWYVMEDKTDIKVQSSVQISGGDGKDIENYRYLLEEV